MPPRTGFKSSSTSYAEGSQEPHLTHPNLGLFIFNEETGTPPDRVTGQIKLNKVKGLMYNRCPVSGQLPDNWCVAP